MNYDEKVLIIQDDKGTLEILGDIAAQAGFEVVLRSNVPPLSEIEQIKLDLILLDHWIGT